MRPRRVLRTITAVTCCTLLCAYAEKAQAADPPTIIDIGTSPLCTTLRESVVPVLVGLHANDALINAGQQQLGRWAHDAWTEGGRGGFWRMDRLRVENVVSSLVRNLNVIDGILNDAKRFPRDKSGSPATTALHDQLQAVEDSQRQTLNDLYAPVDSSMMAEMNELPDRQIQTKAFSAVPAEINAVPRTVGQFVTLGSGSTMDDPVLSNDWPSFGNRPALGSTTVGSTPSPSSLDATQRHIAETESDAAEAVARAVDQCKKAAAPKP
jgi:hypothetical protein